MKYFVSIEGNGELFYAYQGSSGKKAEEVLQMLIRTFQIIKASGMLRYLTDERSGCSGFGDRAGE